MDINRNRYYRERPALNEEFKLQNQQRLKPIVASINLIIDQLMAILSKVSIYYQRKRYLVMWKQLALRKYYSTLIDVLKVFYLGQNYCNYYISADPEWFEDSVKSLEGLIDHLQRFRAGLTVLFKKDLQEFDEILAEIQRDNANGNR